MARIVRTTPPAPRKTFLLKAGLSIFLFLQIQVPVFQEQLLAKAHNLPLNLQTKLTQNAYSAIAKTSSCSLVALVKKVK
jgi:hypothetical protein